MSETKRFLVTCCSIAFDIVRFLDVLKLPRKWSWQKDLFWQNRLSIFLIGAKNSSSTGECSWNTAIFRMLLVACCKAPLKTGRFSWGVITKHPKMTWNCNRGRLPCQNYVKITLGNFWCADKMLFSTSSRDEESQEVQNWPMFGSALLAGLPFGPLASESPFALSRKSLKLHRITIACS
jgi:hypothetical protein